MPSPGKDPIPEYRQEAPLNPRTLFEIKGDVFSRMSKETPSLAYFRARRVPGPVWELEFYALDRTIQEMIWALTGHPMFARHYPRGDWRQLCPPPASVSLWVRRPWLPWSNWRICVASLEPKTIWHEDPYEYITVRAPSPDGPILVRGSVEKVALWLLCSTISWTPILWLFPDEGPPRLKFEGC